MSDETLVVDLNAFTNKSVRGDLTTHPDNRVLLDLYKRADLRFVANRTAVQVNQIRLKDADVASQNYICCDWHLVGHVL
jgi:hypothetical protein